MCRILQDRFWFVHIPFGCMIRTKFIFLHNSLWTTFPTQSCLVLYSFNVCLLPSLIKWLIVFSYSLRVFDSSVSWRLFTGVWVTSNLLKSPGLLLAFWLIAIMQKFDDPHSSLVSKPSSLFNNSLVTIQRVPITIAILVTFMFHIFFHSPARSWYLCLITLSFNFTLWSAETAKFTIL